MTLVVAFVTADASVIETVAAKKTALLPNELRVNGFAALGGGDVTLSAFDTRVGSSVQQLLSWLGWEKATGVVVLTDGSMPGLVDILGDHFSVHHFDPPQYGKKVDNQLAAILSRCLRAFSYFSNRFTDGKYQQIFRLPLRNFHAPEIAVMRDLCRDMMHRNYGREIDGVLRNMRLRQKPKKASDYADVYLVDDNGNHFQLGPEHHAQAETAIPPHDQLCILSNNLRFGRRFDGTTHYNVSRDNGGSMVGVYVDCHGKIRSHRKRTHLNMFTNDYF